jgi:hypothetical protein
VLVVVSLSEILERTKSKVRFVKCNQNEIVFTFIRVNNNVLPISLIESALKNFKEAFDIPVSYSIPLVHNRVLD